MIRWLLQPSVLWPLLAGVMLVAAALAAASMLWLLGILIRMAGG